MLHFYWPVLLPYIRQLLTYTRPFHSHWPGQSLLASTPVNKLENRVWANSCCLHASDDGNWHVQIREKMLSRVVLNCDTYTISILWNNSWQHNSYVICPASVCTVCSWMTANLIVLCRGSVVSTGQLGFGSAPRKAIHTVAAGRHLRNMSPRE